MGAFVAVYNALSFRLVAAPYHLSQVALAAVFLVYAIGSLSSRYAGLLADRIGRRAVLPAAIALAAGGLALTNVSSLPLIIAGIAILTAGFFAGHSVASSWIGRCAHKSPAQASALYLLAYYIGSSIAGPGQRSRLDPRRVEHRHDLVGALLAAALLLSLRLRTTPPLATPAVLELEPGWTAPSLGRAQ
jgi:YNFM family putative membrane transporter